MYYVDLNSDLGESFGAYNIGNDSGIIPLVSSANLACGMHAGDPVVMANAVKLCAAHGVSIGAHPGYPDMQGFGRRELALTPSEADMYVRYQLGALSAVAESLGGRVTHVKLHGAIYNRAAKDYALASAICEGLAKVNPSLIFLGLANSEMIRAAAGAGLRAASEVFADRAYEDDGTLVARSKPNSMIHDEDEMVARVIRMIKRDEVVSVNGKIVPIKCDSVCVHGDGARALAFVKRLREAFADNDIEARKMAI
ncbi:MAG: LamB/YcsF family protein [Oscillospiraceae bacterium]|jgi:UPF0271 protein|nr:LamB/YcsF family protein [Oscillospiraceae bacterium]